MPRAGVAGSVVALLVVVVASPVAGAAGHAALSDRPPARTGPGPTILVTVDVERTPERPGHVRVTYEVDVPDTVEEVEMRLPASYADERERVETEDFQQTREGVRPRYTAFSAGGETRSLTVVYSIPAAPENLDDGAPGYDTGTWTYLSDVRRPLRWVYEGSPPRIEYRIARSDRGFGTRSAVFAGEYAEYTREFGGQRFHLIVPGGVEPESPRAAIFATLNATSRRLRVGERDDEVYVVALALDRDAGERGLVGEAGDRVMWVSAREPASGLGNTWVHEYVHTRQAFARSTGSELRWFTEGSAEYLEYAVPLARSTGSVATARSRLGDPDVTGRLAAPRSWQSGRVAYVRGARAVARLNALIVAATDGRKTVLAVLRELNARSAGTSRPLTGGDLRAAIRAATPVTPRSWYRSYVDGTAPIRVTSRWAFVVDPDGDPDGDGVANVREYDAGTRPFAADTDGDGPTDGVELDRGSDPTAPDAGRDERAGEVELHRGLDPSSDANGSSDGTGGAPTATATASPSPVATGTPTSAPTTTPSPSAGTGALPFGLPLVALLSAFLALRVRSRRRG